MNSAKKILLNLIEKFPEDNIAEVRNEIEIFRKLENASNSSMDFWNNDTDNKLWK